MSIYKIANDFENYWSFHIPNEELFSKMPSYDPRFRAKARLSNWITPDAEFFASENCQAVKPQIPDITTWGYGNLILSPDAYDALKIALQSYGEFLPVNCEGRDYFIFNTLEIINDQCINHEESEQDIQDGIYMGIKRVNFHVNSIDATVFKTSYDKLLYSYCTDKLKETVSSYQLAGLIFEAL